MLPTNHDVPDVVLESATIYLGCTRDDLVEVEIVAWTSGCEAAKSAGATTLPDLAILDRHAQAAVEEALSHYIPLDLARFRDVYALAWLAGYRAQCRAVAH